MALILSGNGLSLTGSVVLQPEPDPVVIDIIVQTEADLDVFTEAGLEITIE